MREHDTAETTREAQEVDPELESPTEDLVYDDVDWDQEAMISDLIDEDMVKEFASRLAQTSVGGSSPGAEQGAEDASPDEAEAELDDEVDDRPDDTTAEHVEHASEEAAGETGDVEDDIDYEDEGDVADRGALDDIIEDILDEGAQGGEAVAAAFAESPLAAGQDLRALDRYGPPTAGVGLVVLAITLAVAYAAGMVVQQQAAYFLSPVQMTVVLVILLGSFTYFVCRGWFKQAWEQRSHALDAAAATVLELESRARSGADDSGQLFREAMDELYSRLRSEMDESAGKLRQDTHRDVQKLRIFFESLLEKHVKRLNDELRQKTSEVEELRLQQQEGEKEDSEVVRLTRENQSLKAKFEDLEVELEQVDKDRRLKETELEQLHLQLQAGQDASSAGAADEERAPPEDPSENERLRGELARLEADLAAKGEECRRLSGELEDLVRGAKVTSQGSLQLFDKVSDQLVRNLELAFELAGQLSDEEGASEATDSDSSLTIDISGHLERLQRLVAQIVDLARLHDGEAARSEIKVKDLLQERLERVRPTADQSEIKLSVRVPKDLPEVTTDKRLVERAIDELVANAVVYTNPGGRLTLRARLEREETGADCLCLSVQDNGEGMSKSEATAVLEPFERGKHPRPSLFGAGAGLGLALAKGCAEELGGEIEVESKQGKGSTFTVKVPVEVGG